MTGRARTWTAVLRGGAAGLILLAVGVFIATANADRPKSALDLQPFRSTESVAVRSPGHGEATATLVNLNPTIGVWYVLQVSSNGAGPALTYHLEVARQSIQRLELDRGYPTGLWIVEGQNRYRCDLFSATSPDRLELARASGSTFQPLCESRIYLRNHATGHQTDLETATDFLRTRVWGGESLIELGHHVMAGWNYETSRAAPNGVSSESIQKQGPRAALVDPDAARRHVVSNNLGISVVGNGAFVPGAWYAATGPAGVYVSLLQPNMIEGDILKGGEKSVSALDSVEASALTYLIAFDLDRFELGYAVGTNNPAVGWSAHMQPHMRDPQLPGPDGIGTIAPLVATGLVNPGEALRTVAAFAGGFRRIHGAFLYGEFAAKNHASHYGFVQNGTVLSTLQPGLATIFGLADGTVQMKTWSDDDKQLLPRIRFARQNGVPIVEFDDRLRTTVPGPLVNEWGPGNWSGTEDRRLRTIRAGAALQEAGGKRFLIYAVFSTATPSAMARVFQAYRCRYAMLLDMNALEHTYMALYQRTGSSLTIEHLIKGMGQADPVSGGRVVPRFTGYPDNRDFFYVMPRSQEAHP